jgi:hypothetical protein
LAETRDHNPTSQLLLYTSDPNWDLMEVDLLKPSVGCGHPSYLEEVFGLAVEVFLQIAKVVFEYDDVI